ncbi:MAG: sugar phosphate isomerase/epimerase [Phycisphaerae bacterium]|nr:sugar phosphate isomerase/epimerase [Phycisphaerae bacterium]
MKPNHNRREFLQIATAGAAALVAAPVWGAESNKKGKGRNRQSQKASTPASTEGRKLPFELGLASYTCRKFDLKQTLAMANRAGLKHIALKDVHLAMNSSPEQIKEVVAQVKDAGLDLYGGGVIYMRNEAQVNEAFDYAKAAGMRVIIGVPEPELLPLVNKKVKEYDIKVAIHNHGPTDKVYPIPATAYEKIKDLDKRIGLCDDIGHTARAGVDSATSLEQFADRLLDIHIKDVTAANPKGGTTEVGRGVISIPQVIRTLVKINYTGIVSFEYEDRPDDPLPGLAESVGYVRGVMATV